MTQATGGTGFPLPGTGRATVAVPAPGPGEGRWVGAPSAALDPDGTFVLAYRVRMVDRRGAATVVARSADGERHHRRTLDKERFGADVDGAPALVRTAGGPLAAVRVLRHARAASTGGSTCSRPTIPPGWRRRPRRSSRRRPARGEGPGHPPRRRRWHAWICCHPLDVPAEEDRMTTAYATSDGRAGLDLARHGAWPAGRGTGTPAAPGSPPCSPDGRAAYDGRATEEENFSERTGLAVPAGRRPLRPSRRRPVAAVRYLDVLPLPDGGHRLSTRPRCPTAATSCAPSWSSRARHNQQHAISRSATLPHRGTWCGSAGFQRRTWHGFAVVERWDRARVCRVSNGGSCVRLPGSSGEPGLVCRVERGRVPTAPRG